MKHSNSPLDALERLNVILGGRDDDAVNITEAIDQIADAIEAGGGGGGGVTIVIDKTLTKSGQAADAKAAGDAIKNVKITVDTTLTKTGMAADAKVTGDAIKVAGAVDQNLTKTGVAADAAATGYAINISKVIVDNTLTKSGQAADAKAVGDRFRDLSVPTDTTLTIAGMPADSKTVGDRLLALQNAIGAPKVANTANEMTDVDNVYVYTGNEAGYNTGHWYYYDNLLWHDGGVYNAVAVNTDTSLTVSGQAADAAAVGNLRSDLSYIPIEITELSVEPEFAEIGSTLNTATVLYTLNKIPNILRLGDETLSNAASGSKSLSSMGAVADTVLTLEATDAGSYSHLATTATKSAMIKFVNRVFYGVKAVGTLNSAFVLSLANKILSDTKSRTITVNSANNTYIWYAYPAAFGTSVFRIGGIEGGFEPAETVSVTNESGYTEDYYVYRSTEKTLGLTTVEVF